MTSTMTPFGIVFLTLMFGVIIPSPTNGKIKMTVREAMNMSRSALEKRQSGDSNELDAFRNFMFCLETAGALGGEICGAGKLKARMEEASKKYIVIEDIPLEDWLQIAALKCVRDNFSEGTLVCYEEWGTCCPRDFAEKIKTQGGSSDECRIAKDSRGSKCEAEYAAFQRFSPTAPDATTLRNSVSVSKSGWYITVMVATAYAISCRHLFSP